MRMPVGLGRMRGERETVTQVMEKHGIAPLTLTLDAQMVGRLPDGTPIYVADPATLWQTPATELALYHPSLPGVYQRRQQIVRGYSPAALVDGRANTSSSFLGSFADRLLHRPGGINETLDGIVASEKSGTLAKTVHGQKGLIRNLIQSFPADIGQTQVVPNITGSGVGALAATPVFPRLKFDPIFLHFPDLPFEHPLNAACLAVFLEAFLALAIPYRPLLGRAKNHVQSTVASTAIAEAPNLSVAQVFAICEIAFAKSLFGVGYMHVSNTSLLAQPL